MPKVEYISQGMLRDFQKVREKELCSLKWHSMYLGSHKFTPTESMLAGLVFEQQVIGMSRGGEVYNFPKLKSGKDSKIEIDINNLSIFAKETLITLDMKLLEVQPEWKVDDLIGHPDALITFKGEKAIMDLKYTATKEDDSARWNPFAWGRDLEYKDYSQAVQYVEMYYRMTGEYLPFFFLVFGKSGWVKLISIDVSKAALLEHSDKLDAFKEDVKHFEFEGSSSYSECRKCNINCLERVLEPNCITIEI